VCGLAAIQSRGGVAPWDVRSAASAAGLAQAHRGPDGEGLWSTEPASGDSATALAHRRLAILDPSPAGAQPMHDPDTGNVLVLNGEIYNHRALREELAGPWRSGSDTETLLRAYAVWGEACLERLQGMFAFALWDARRRLLWCARDRFGVKPLYLAEGARGVALASEVRALVACGAAAARVDRAGLHGFLRFGCVPDPLTLVEGVRALPAGHTLHVRDGRIERESAWWSTRARLAGERGATDLRAALERAVAEHLASDVPVAWLLSGGLDAALLLALAPRDRRRAAFTLAWDDPHLDESQAAAAIARHVGCEHHVVRLKDEEAASEVMRAVQAFDLPTIDGVNTWLIARAIAGAGFKVALSGLGGDELFGGYPSFRWVPRAARWAPLLGRLPGWSRALLLGRHRAERAGELLAVGAAPGSRVAAVRSLWGRGALARALPGFAPGATSRGAAEDRPLPMHVEVGLEELEGYMRSMLLRDTDALAMAHGVELRVPFLDSRVVLGALAAARDGAPVAMRDKRRLRALARELLPPAALARRKQGFVLPMQRWLEGPLAPFLRAGLEQVRSLGLVAEPFLDEVEAGFAQRRLAWSRPWALAVLGHWAARHLRSERAVA